MGIASRRSIVVDVGKSLSKVTLWSGGGALLDRQVRANATVMTEGLVRLDAEGIGAWLIAALARYANETVDAIIPVAHGAGVVGLEGGALAYPPLDYEQPILAEAATAYGVERDPFAATGSPTLPDGLNLGRQLFWLDQLKPEAAGAMLLPWAQYWAWFLSGVAASEVTSLGCHTDLWFPAKARFSDLAERFGWARRFAPLRSANETIGTLRPEIARVTGLSTAVKVLAGLHDSNAALHAARSFDAIEGQEATVLSTGTWFVAMRLMGGNAAVPSLAEACDCLVNVDIAGRPVPSARFMGGREIETAVELPTRQVDLGPDQPGLLAALPRVASTGVMLLPTLAPGCGPFPRGRTRWVAPSEDWYIHRAAACLYAAMVADRSLDLIGSRERLLVEGRFAKAEVFVRALASLRPDTEVLVADADNDVSFGALRVLDPTLKPASRLRRIVPLEIDLGAYHTRWLARADEAEAA